MLQTTHSTLVSGNRCRIAQHSSRISRPSSQIIVCKSTIKRTVKESTKKVEDEQQQQRSVFENIVSTLLFRAASRRERGVATCLECRGSGYCTCSYCKGLGTTAPKNRSSMKEQVLRNKLVLGVEKGDHWLTTNRCLKCHGAGRVMCADCEGTGLRAPALTPGIASSKAADLAS